MQGPGRAEPRAPGGAFEPGGEPMIFGVHHMAIKARDLPVCERFYREVLGLDVIRRWPASSGDGDRSVWLGTDDAGSSFLALESIGGAVPGTVVGAARSEAPGHHLLALRIARDRRAAWESRLAAAGVPITHRTAYTIYFVDPEGNRLGLSHYPDPETDPRPPTLAGPAIEGDQDPERRG